MEGAKTFSNNKNIKYKISEFVLSALLACYADVATYNSIFIIFANEFDRSVPALIHCAFNVAFVPPCLITSCGTVDNCILVFRLIHIKSVLLLIPFCVE